MSAAVVSLDGLWAPRAAAGAVARVYTRTVTPGPGAADGRSWRQRCCGEVVQPKPSKEGFTTPARPNNAPPRPTSSAESRARRAMRRTASRFTGRRGNVWDGATCYHTFGNATTAVTRCRATRVKRQENAGHAGAPAAHRDAGCPPRFAAGCATTRASGAESSCRVAGRQGLCAGRGFALGPYRDDGSLLPTEPPRLLSGATRPSLCAPSACTIAAPSCSRRGPRATVVAHAPLPSVRRCGTTVAAPFPRPPLRCRLRQGLRLRQDVRPERQLRRVWRYSRRWVGPHSRSPCCVDGSHAKPACGCGKTQNPKGLCDGSHAFLTEAEKKAKAQGASK